MSKGLINIDTKRFESMSVELSKFPKEVEKATYHALKRSVDNIAAETARQITGRYGIKSTDAKQFIKPVYPTKTDMSAGVIVKGHTLSMYHFKFTPTKQGARRPIKATIIKGSKKGLGKTSFVAKTGKDGSPLNVWMRLKGQKTVMQKGRYEGKVREKIALIRTLSVPQMASNIEVSSNIQEHGMKKFQERFDHEINRAFSNAQKKVGG